MAARTASASTKRPERRPRELQKPRRGKRIKRHLKVVRQPLPGAWRLLWRSVVHLVRYRRVFGGIVLIYLVLTIILVRGFGVRTNVPALKETLQAGLHGAVAAVGTGLTLFGILVGSVGSATSDVAGAYQTIILITVSLALIWALRQTHSEERPKLQIRDTFYKGEYPLVPFVLTLLVVGLELIPLILAVTLYNLVFGNGLAVQWYEQYAWAAGLFLLTLWSLYMVSSSIFALYIVTLPEVRPFQALRSAKELVRYRRWVVLRKVAFLPVALLVLAAGIIVPLTFIWPKGVEWVFLLLNMSGLAIVHSYLYSLYRSLL